MQLIRFRSGRKQILRETKTSKQTCSITRPRRGSAPEMDALPVEKSPGNHRFGDTAYPPFTGFASDTNLLSLPSKQNQKHLLPNAEPDGGQFHGGRQSPNEAPAAQGAPWGSAANTKEWLETSAARGLARKRWQQHRANVYLLASACS